MRNRYRRMYELTGLPGWMRFGYSPGWKDRSPSGLGPCAHYLMNGTWPATQMNAAWQQGRIPFTFDQGFPMPGFATPYDPWGAAALSPERELDFLKAEALRLRDGLTAIEQRIRDLQGKEK